MTSSYGSYFSRLASLPEGGAAHPWQLQTAGDPSCSNRLIRVPTGFGKTFGILGAWLWNRIEAKDPRWPRRLVWCLPMRVLVEQVVAEIQSALQRVGGHAGAVRVHALMGGVEAADWHLAPEREAVLVGTQDMLLSRTMNRGYGAARARWPMDFGLLNQDCLWVMDEVQLMDVALATSAQLQAFREQDAAQGKSKRPCKTWWMSATLQEAWIQASRDTQEPLRDLPHTRIAARERVGPLWDEDKVRKPLRIELVSNARKLASLAVTAHLEAGRGAQGPTLIVVNRVDLAVQVYDTLHEEAMKSLRGTDLRLVHSRFRPADRADWREAFLNRGACAPGTDRIIVATQVVEAGVDMSAAVLITELSPWPSLVQRFGRCARWGGSAQVIVADGQAKGDKAAPYTEAELDAAREALALLSDVAPKHLEAFEDAHPELQSRLYPYNPAHLLMRDELEELFDTTADLSGADIDISRFIRSGEERDLHVFWRAVEQTGAKPDASVRAVRDELCAIPLRKAREWLCPNGKPAARAWVWDWLEGEWARVEPRRLYPGQTVVVAADVGGYDPRRGWDPGSKIEVDPIMPSTTPIVVSDDADNSENDESLSVAKGWQTIAFHGEQVGRHGSALASILVPELAPLFNLAGRWHDVGKVHPAFQGCLRTHSHGQQIAKAPDGYWLRGSQLYRMPNQNQRRGFRHELASTLALLALLRRCDPDHAALLGPWRQLLERLPASDALPPRQARNMAGEPTVIEREVLELDAEQFDLLLYLVCSHHGKVRMSWHASPADQAANDATLRIRGVRAGDMLPSLALADAQGERHVLPEAELVLAPAAAGLNPHTGRGWTERVLGLLERHGPFTLAWLEALMRAADQHATRDTALSDPALQADNATYGLERGNSSVAGVAGRGETPPPLGERSPQRREELRLRGRASGSGAAGGRTRPPVHATRYLETRLGTLSYLELAPHLASAARQVESEIESGHFDKHPLDDQVIAALQRRLCAQLTPQLAGWRRQPVLVGTHTPPEPHHVPMLMREYALDLQARLQAGAKDEWLIETLAFAEGRLLSIHPLTDFNGRTTRLFLRLLLRRLDLPDVDLTPDAEQSEHYFLAFRAGDHRNWKPLGEIWRRRFEQGVQP